MPRPTPVPADVREAVLADIRAGVGRNAIARARRISAGSVSSIARTSGAAFPRCEHTAAATRARRIDLAAARAEREADLWAIYLSAPTRRDGTEPRRSRRASYALYDIERKNRGGGASSYRRPFDPELEHLLAVSELACTVADNDDGTYSNGGGDE